jgi:hypothetical protein
MTKLLIAGVGPAGTATTLVNVIMGGLPGVFAMGNLNQSQDYRGVVDGKQVGAFCNECGPALACPVFTPDVLRRCLIDEKSTYQIIGGQVAEDVLYTQDNRGELFERKGIPDRVLVLHRDIRAWCAAWALLLVGEVRTTRTIDQALPIPGITHYKSALDHWINFYRSQIGWLNSKKIPWWSLNTDVLRQFPEPTLRRICKTLGLQFSQQALRWWENRHHKMGGRFNVKAGLQSRLGKTIAYDEAWRKYMTVEQLDYLESQKSQYQGILDQFENQKLPEAG